MAIYHLSVKIHSRSTGASVVAAAAYRAGEKLRDERARHTHDYRRKRGVIHREILLPEGAPAAWRDRAALWNAVAMGERRHDAQMAREIEIALPRELSLEANIQMARDFARAECVRLGMVADLAVHLARGSDGRPQLHAHILLTLRRIGPEGSFGQKAREWNNPALLARWRERWASLANAQLAECGHDIRIDHRSLAAQGVALIPQKKIGPVAGGRRMAEIRENSGPAMMHREIARANGARIIARPALALDAITAQQATFTRPDLLRLLHRYTDGEEQFAQALARVETSPDLVRLGRDGRGEVRFTTRGMLACERDLAADGASLAAGRGHPTFSEARIRGAATDAGLGKDQAEALRHIGGSADLALIVGFAGTGKSTLLGTARDIWVAAGYRVRGVALSGIAAEGLQQGARITSRTIASQMLAWRRGRERLRANEILVVDEAGMVGSRDMQALLAAAKAAGAKVVLVGDAEQLQPIAAGTPFRLLVERFGAAVIKTVRRQREAWQQQATEELATAKTGAALARYMAAGRVRAHDAIEAAKSALIEEWTEGRRSAPGATRIILAHRRADVRDLNARARAIRRREGELGADVELPTSAGVCDFAEKDRIYFLRNETGLGVKNGSLGTIAAIVGQGASARLTVRLDNGREIAFVPRDYDDIAHGYAATVHKTQGVTVDYAHVLASGGMDRHLAYVALSRHREAVSLHWSADEMGDVERLVAILSRERRSENALDYVGADVARQTASFAARRGIVPESAIVLKRQRETPNAVVNSPRPVGAKGKRPSPVITTSGGVRRRPATFSEAVSGAMERALASAWEGGRAQAAAVAGHVRSGTAAVGGGAATLIAGAGRRIAQVFAAKTAPTPSGDVAPAAKATRAHAPEAAPREAKAVAKKEAAARTVAREEPRPRKAPPAPAPVPEARAEPSRDIAAELRRHRANFTDALTELRAVVVAWEGRGDQEVVLATSATNAARAAAAIAADPGMMAMLAVEDPKEALLVEKIADTGTKDLFAWARREIVKHNPAKATPAPAPRPAPALKRATAAEQESEPAPAPGMGMRR
ncbi:MAG: Ti-type conjugative transfer relaxase TraA [Rhodospirillales bacterium]|nr:Ti-type conjugative transfer relaxase TraA [Rhodospirillales bacterium]